VESGVEISRASVLVANMKKNCESSQQKMWEP